MGVSARVRASAVAGVFLLAGVWVCVEALQVPVGSLRMPGAGFFPLVLGLTLSGLAVAMFGVGWIGRDAGVARVWPERREVLYVAATLVASAWLFERAGFLIAMGLFLAVSIHVLAPGRWVRTVVTALIGAVTSWWVFGRLLQISLPGGVLGF